MDPDVTQNNLAELIHIAMSPARWAFDADCDTRETAAAAYAIFAAHGWHGEHGNERDNDLTGPADTGVYFVQVYHQERAKSADYGLTPTTTPTLE